MSAYLRAFSDRPGNLTARIISIYTVLVAANVAAWSWAFVAFHDHPILLGTSFLAYSFGLRHAVDADHIASIDNVTRKLMQEGKQPLTVGLFFSLGHSTVVVTGASLVYWTATVLEVRFAEFKQIATLVGTFISASFLFVIAGMNILILRGIYQ